MARRKEEPMEVDGPNDRAARASAPSWTFCGEDAEKLSLFESRIQTQKTIGSIKIEEEDSPSQKVTITLCNAADSYTYKVMTKLQKEIEGVHVECIHVQKEHVDAAKKFVKENGSYTFFKLFLNPVHNSIRMYAKIKSDLCDAKESWKSFLQMHDGKQSSYDAHGRSNTTNTASNRPLQPSGNKTHSPVCTTKERLNVFVYKESILNTAVDVIVNAANEDLLHLGGVAAIIAQAAGQKLYDESNELINRNGNYRVTDVEMTSAGHLRYKFVLHAVGPRWEKYSDKMQCLADLKQTIVNVLGKAERRGVTSIAFPAISAGLFGVPKELCADTYAVAIHEFSQGRGSSSSVRDVHFVDVDGIMVLKMKSAFEDLGKKSLTSLDIIKTRHPYIQWKDLSSSARSPSKSHSSSNRGSESLYRGQSSQSQPTAAPSQGARPKVKLTSLPDVATIANIPVKAFQFGNGLVVKIYTGSIVKFRGDAIVISADTGLTGTGFLSEAVRKAGGIEYEKEFDKIRRKTAKVGDALYCKGGRIEVNYVMHLILDRLFCTLGSRLEEYKNHLRDAFTKMNDHSWKKIAMPLIGAGFIEKDLRDLQKCCGAWYSVLSMFAFNREHTCRISEIHLINKDSKVTSALVDVFQANSSVDVASATHPSNGQKSFRDQKEHSRGTNPSDFSRTTGSRHHFQSQNKAQEGHGQEQNKVNFRKHGYGHESSFRSKSSKAHGGAMQQSRASADYSQYGAKPKETFVRSLSEPLSSGAEKDFDVEAFFQPKQPVAKKNGTVKPSGNLQIIDSDSDDSADGAYETVSSRMKKPLKSKDEESSTPCVICLGDITNGMKLDCGHEFCKECLQQSFKQHKQACPVCGTIYGIVKGNQPENGKMSVKVDKYHSLPGYEECGTITVKYYFPDGIQGPEHPNPGELYEGTERRGFLPDNKEGQKVLKLLKKAFERRLTFTIGYSRTTGKDNVVTWNDIHHKTKRDTGAQRFGYPDPTYLQRVQEELAAKGVTAD